MTDQASLISFLQSELLVLVKESKSKWPEVKTAAETSLALIKQLKSASLSPDASSSTTSLTLSLKKNSSILVKAMLQACHARANPTSSSPPPGPLVPRLLSIGLNLLHRLATYDIFGSSDLALVVQCLERGLEGTGLALDTNQPSPSLFSDTQTGDLQLKLLQSLMPIFINHNLLQLDDTNTTESDLTLNTVYRISFRLHDSPLNMVSNASIPVIRQLLLFLFDTLVTKIQQGLSNFSGESLPRLAFLLFNDLCLMGSCENPQMLPAPLVRSPTIGSRGSSTLTSPVTSTPAGSITTQTHVSPVGSAMWPMSITPAQQHMVVFCLELLEAVLGSSYLDIYQHPCSKDTFVASLKDRICTMLIRLVTDPVDQNFYPLTCRLWRMIQLILAQPGLHGLIPLETEIFVTFLVRCIDDEQQRLWELTLLLETIHSCFKIDTEHGLSILASLHRTCMDQDAGLHAVRDLVQALCRLLVKKLGTITPIRFADTRIRCLSQFDKQVPPLVTPGYPLLLSFQCLISLFEDDCTLPKDDTLAIARDLFLPCYLDFQEAMVRVFLTQLDNSQPWADSILIIWHRMLVTCSKLCIDPSTRTIAHQPLQSLSERAVELALTPHHENFHIAEEATQSSSHAFSSLKAFLPFNLMGSRGSATVPQVPERSIPVQSLHFDLARILLEQSLPLIREHLDRYKGWPAFIRLAYIIYKANLGEEQRIEGVDHTLNLSKMRRSVSPAFVGEGRDRSGSKSPLSKVPSIPVLPSVHPLAPSSIISSLVELAQLFLIDESGTLISEDSFEAFISAFLDSLLPIDQDNTSSTVLEIRGNENIPLVIPAWTLLQLPRIFAVNLHRFVISDDQPSPPGWNALSQALVPLFLDQDNPVKQTVARTCLLGTLHLYVDRVKQLRLDNDIEATFSDTRPFTWLSLLTRASVDPIIVLDGLQICIQGMVMRTSGEENLDCLISHRAWVTVLDLLLVDMGEQLTQSTGICMQAFTIFRIITTEYLPFIFRPSASKEITLRLAIKLVDCALKLFCPASRNDPEMLNMGLSCVSLCWDIVQHFSNQSVADGECGSSLLLYVIELMSELCATDPRPELKDSLVPILFRVIRTLVCLAHQQNLIDDPGSHEVPSTIRRLLGTLLKKLASDTHDNTPALLSIINQYTILWTTSDNDTATLNILGMEVLRELVLDILISPLFCLSNDNGQLVMGGVTCLHKLTDCFIVGQQGRLSDDTFLDLFWTAWTMVFPKNETSRPLFDQDSMLIYLDIIRLFPCLASEQPSLPDESLAVNIFETCLTLKPGIICFKMTKVQEVILELVKARVSDRQLRISTLTRWMRLSDEKLDQNGTLDDPQLFFYDHFLRVSDAQFAFQKEYLEGSWNSLKKQFKEFPYQDVHFSTSVHYQELISMNSLNQDRYASSFIPMTLEIIECLRCELFDDDFSRQALIESSLQSLLMILRHFICIKYHGPREGIPGGRQIWTMSTSLYCQLTESWTLHMNPKLAPLIVDIAINYIYATRCQDPPSIPGLILKEEFDRDDVVYDAPFVANFLMRLVKELAVSGQEHLINDLCDTLVWASHFSPPILDTLVVEGYLDQCRQSVDQGSSTVHPHFSRLELDIDQDTADLNRFSIPASKIAFVEACLKTLFSLANVNEHLYTLSCKRLVQVIERWKREKHSYGPVPLPSLRKHELICVLECVAKDRDRLMNTQIKSLLLDMLTLIDWTLQTWPAQSMLFYPRDPRNDNVTLYIQNHPECKTTVDKLFDDHDENDKECCIFMDPCSSSSSWILSFDSRLVHYINFLLRYGENENSLISFRDVAEVGSKGVHELLSEF